jgi:SNF2 family DNA or RNA helicase
VVQLLEVQKAAIKAAYGKPGFAYWMEMGLGKTLTALVEFEFLVHDGKITRLVVVCPNSFKGGWVAEIIKQDVNVDPWIYESGADNERFLHRAFSKPPVLIVNYEAIRRAGTQAYIMRFIAGRKCMIVFDESIQLKNNKADQTKAAIALAQNFQYARVLSGKPITQGPHDLWGQMRAIGKLNGTNFYAFRGMFCRMGGYMAKKVVGAQNEEQLASLIDPHVFRATKDQWIDLPPKIYTIREVSMGAAQARQYKTMEQEFVTWLQSGENVSVDLAITKHIKLAQIQFGFLIDEDQEVHELVSPAENPRINAIKEMLDTEVVGKAIIVYHHRYAGVVLLNELEEYKPAFIRGGMTDAELTGSRYEFNENPKCRVILIQTTAGRYGHTLIGRNTITERCSTMIFAENTWSLDTRSQLEDRMHRIGQKGDSCLYIDMVGSSLDRRIVQALQQKQSIFDAVMKHIKR